jgi:hypothetical protein
MTTPDELRAMRDRWTCAARIADADAQWAVNDLPSPCAVIVAHLESVAREIREAVAVIDARIRALETETR